MSAHPELPTVQQETLEDAKALVLGVVTARRRNAPGDTHVLIDSYMADAMARGVPKDTAWSLLFSAATIWVDSLIECRAEHHRQPVRTAITELAMELARG